ncbi:hypothetical protein U1Q18_010141 [Sarracenia purpurea var. burkii]
METAERDDDEMGPAQFAAAIARIAVAQICKSAGFSSIQRAALETLTDVAARYLRILAVAAASYAISSGRTQSNLYDVVRALEDLASVQGFRGASNLNHSVLASSTLTDLAKFVKYSDEIPFAKPIRLRRCPEQTIPLPGNDQKLTRSVGFLHIPRWLPPIPEMGASEMGGKVTQGEDKSCIGLDSCGEVGGRCLVGEKMKELPEKRPRVRFKMGFGLGCGLGRKLDGIEVRKEGLGVDLRTGICRGGKRVSCQSRTEEEEDHKKSKCRDQERESIHP